MIIDVSKEDSLQAAIAKCNSNRPNTLYCPGGKNAYDGDVTINHNMRLVGDGYRSRLTGNITVAATMPTLISGLSFEGETFLDRAKHVTLQNMLFRRRVYESDWGTYYIHYLHSFFDNPEDEWALGMRSNGGSAVGCSFHARKCIDLIGSNNLIDLAQIESNTHPQDDGLYGIRASGNYNRILHPRLEAGQGNAWNGSPVILNEDARSCVVEIAHRDWKANDLGALIVQDLGINNQVTILPYKD